MTVHVDHHAVGAIVLDIEGTTTPIAFVYDVLFPYARAHLREYVQTHAGTSASAEVEARLRQEWAEDMARGEHPPPCENLVSYLTWLMDRDRKSPGLKEIQGRIWEQGYLDGELKSVVFEDVPPALARWRRAGVSLAIYSSGSVLAQRLLFGHTPFGDLTPFFDGFFDTGVGPKIATDSYTRIAEALGHPASGLLFVSDAASELDAAHHAGCRTVLCVRPGNPAQVPGIPVDLVRSFDEITVS